jgi:hypothetical protein
MKCLVALIACIGNRRTAGLLDRECTKVTKKIAVWYYRLWLIRICGYGMLSSVWQDLTMTSMSRSALICPPG